METVFQCKKTETGVTLVRRDRKRENRNYSGFRIWKR